MERFRESSTGYGDTIEEMMSNEDHAMFFDELESVLRIDRAALKPHYWRGPSYRTLSPLCSPRAPGPFTIYLDHGQFQLGRNMWGGCGLGHCVDPLVGKAYMFKAATFLGRALDQSEMKAEKMRQEARRENEEWLQRMCFFKAHSKYVDESTLPPDASF